MEGEIGELGYENSDLTSSNSKYSSGNIHFLFYKKPTSLAGTKKFKTDRKYSVKILVVTNPTDLVLQ